MKVDRHHDPVIELESRLLSELDFIAQQLRGKLLIMCMRIVKENNRK